MNTTIYYRSQFKILKGGKIGLIISSLLSSTILLAAPSGESIVNGNININRDIPNTTNINQGTNKGIVNWQKFDVNTNEIVNFNQPNNSSSTLNRVISNNPSKIYGQINSNGQVFLVNQNGIYFGKNSKVNTAGFTASTLDITNENFLNNNYTFEGNSNASILNLGTINTDNAYTALLAKEVINEGVIQARLGNVQLASGEKITLDINGNSLVKLTIDKGTLDSLVENKGLVKADGGRVYLTTKALDEVLNGVVNNTGVIYANAIEEKDGKIILFAHGGTAEIAGTLEAKDGFIETSGKNFTINKNTKVKAKKWLIDPTNINITDTTAYENSLNSGTDVDIETQVAGTEDGYIVVNDDITWNTANKLTLKAHKDITINKSITATNATGKLALHYGQGTVAGNNAKYDVNAPINLKAGDNFETKLGSNGTINTWKVITSLGAEGSNTGVDLQGMNASLGGKFVLGANINASNTSTWNGGFNPIGNVLTSGFTGHFDGLGHTIDLLNMNRGNASYQGLFGQAKNGSTIKNIGVTNVNITGNATSVGGLVGKNYATIQNSYATGTVSGSYYVGGLVGSNSSGTIQNSYATGNVSGTYYVGGLTGRNLYIIQNSYATGNVSGTNYVGGLVGYNYNKIQNTYSTGAVSGTNNVGGLVGRTGNINVINSFWDTQTSGQYTSDLGTGLSTSQMKNTKTFYNAGWDLDTIWGRDTNNVDNSGYLSLRGLSSFVFNTVVGMTVVDQTKVYDATSSITTTLSKNNIIDNVTAFTKNVGSNAFTSNLGDYELTYKTGYNNSNTEVLLYNSGKSTITPKVLTLSNITSNNKVYDGTRTVTTTANLTGVITGDTVSNSISSTFDNKNAGVGKTVTLDLVTIEGIDKSNYSIVPGQTTTADVSKKDLTLSNITADNKAYDGTTTASTYATLTGLISGDDVSIASTFDNKYVGVNKTVILNSLTGRDGTNYFIVSGQTTTANITTPLYQNILSRILKDAGNNKEIKEIFVRNNNLIVILEDNKQLRLRRVTQEQLKEEEERNDIKLALVPNRLIKLFNRGLKLPNNLEQDFYMIDETN